MSRENKNNDVANKITTKNGGSSMKNNGKFYYSWFNDNEIYFVDTAIKINDIFGKIIKHDDVRQETGDSIVNFHEEEFCGIKFRFVHTGVMVLLVKLETIKILEDAGRVTSSLLRFSDAKEYRIRDRVKWIKSVISENQKDSDSGDDCIDICCTNCGFKFVFNYVNNSQIICPNCSFRNETLEFAIDLAAEEF